MTWDIMIQWTIITATTIPWIIHVEIYMLSFFGGRPTATSLKLLSHLFNLIWLKFGQKYKN